MAGKQKPKDFRQEFLICTICANPFNHEERIPKCLPCLHCFCTACLSRLVAGQTDVKCPTCRKKCKVPETGAEGFVTNFNIENLKEYQYLHEIGRGDSNEGQTCTNCEQNDPATGYCYDCSTYVCQQCTLEHQTSRIRQLRNHKIVALIDYQSESENHQRHLTEQYCMVHTKTKKVLTLFCQICQTPICETCALTEHRDHNMLEDLDKAMEEAIENLHQLSNKVKERKKPIDILLELLDTKINEINTLRSQQERQIDDTFGDLEARLRSRKDLSKEELGEVCVMMTKRLRDQKDDVEALATQFESAFDFAEHTCRYANPVQLFQHREMVTQQLRDLIETETDVPQFAQPIVNSFLSFTPEHQESIQKFDESLIPLGAIRTSSTVAYLCQVEGLCKESSINTSQCVIVRAIDSNGIQQTEGGDHVTANLQVPDGRIVECQVEDTQDGLYSVGFIPENAGNYKLHIHAFGKPIKGSPFQINIKEDDVQDQSDFAMVEYPVAIVGHTHKISINLSKDGGTRQEARVDRLHAEVVTQTGHKVSCEIQNRDNGKFCVQYIPPMEGPISLHLKVNDIPLSDSPYTINVSPVSPKATNVSFDQPIRNQNWPIIITPFDYRQRRVAVPPEALLAKITDLASQKKYALTPTRAANGSYIIRFVPRSSLYKMRVLLHGILVKEVEINVMAHLDFKLSGSPQSFPTGIATGTTNLTYVSDTTDGKIHALKPNGSIEYNIELPVNQTSQITIDDQGRLLLLFPQNKIVLLLDQQGNELNQWRCQKKNSRPVTMASTKDGRVVVADAKEPSMYIYKSDGKLIAKGKLPTTSIVDGINNVCVDAKNRIVVAHHTEHLIYLYDSDGRLISHFKSGATSYQLAVAATVDNFLLVSQLGQIRVFNDAQEFIAEIPIISGHIYTNLASMHDGSFMSLDVGQKQLVKYGYKIIPE